MGKSIRDIAKRPGRPKTTGPGTGVMVKMHDPQLDAIDAWISKQKEPDLTRPEAIRRLVELGLTVKTKARPTGRLSTALVADLAAESIDSLGPPVKAPARPVGEPGRKLRARELAIKAIEKIIDPTAPPEERAQRRRRLTKGPTEFREARVDQPKVKAK
jgi:hypothetical protein